MRGMLAALQERLRRAARLCFQRLRHLADHRRATRRECETVAGVLLGGAEEIAHPDAAPPLEGREIGIHRAGNADGEWPARWHPADVAAFVIEHRAWRSCGAAPLPLTPVTFCVFAS